jgi:hypothetical protein
MCPELDREWDGRKLESGSKDPKTDDGTEHPKAAFASVSFLVIIPKTIGRRQSLCVSVASHLGYLELKSSAAVNVCSREAQ